MKILTGALAAITLLAALQFGGCNKDNNLESSLTDAQYFGEVVGGTDASTSDLLVSEQQALEDGAMYNVAEKALPPSIQSVTAGTIVPMYWGRYIESATRSVTRTTLEGDSVAVLRADLSFSGKFVIVGTENGVLDTIYKPFTESMHRYLRFLRVANTRSARLNWRLDAISMLNGGTSNVQISIGQLQVLPPTGDTLSATDPDNYFMQVNHRWMRRLPLWGFNSQVTVNATVHSSDPDSDFVFLHYVPRVAGPHRARMAMTSQTGDPVTGYTRTYSLTFTIPGNDKKFSGLVVSATTAGTLFSADTTNISSAIWGVPYKTSE